MSSAPSAAQSAANAVNANLAARQYALANFPRELLSIGTFGSFAPGANMRQKLTNVGILRSILLEVTVNYNVTTAATQSRLAPYNLLSTVKVKDYQGTERINASGDQIFNLQTVKYAKRPGCTNANAQAMPFTTPIYSFNGAMPTAVANNNSYTFFLRLPLAYHPEVDLRGSLLMQSITGESFVEALFNGSFFGTNDDSVFSAGAGSVNSINVQVYQDYLGIVMAPNGALPPLPQIDLGTVYELNGSMTTNSDLAVGQERLLNYVNYRSVLSAIVRYSSGGNQVAGNISQFRLVVNGNQYLQTWGERALVMATREGVGVDLPPGCYYFSTRHKPIDTILYGNVQLGVTPNAVPANSLIAPLFESFYAVGSPLTGMSQA